MQHFLSCMLDKYIALIQSFDNSKVLLVPLEQIYFIKAYQVLVKSYIYSRYIYSNATNKQQHDYRKESFDLFSILCYIQDNNLSLCLFISYTCVCVYIGTLSLGGCHFYRYGVYQGGGRHYVSKCTLVDPPPLLSRHSNTSGVDHKAT